tara:strand:- start:2702 stop:3790 length:1089 start_codon:yes stop_codon:yes gene_type:complete
MSDKNIHLEHIEDQILNLGTKGARDSISLLQKGFVATVKYDGSPAVFAGTDPSDGKFFVAKKSVFNKTPILYKTPGQIKKADLPNDLKDKFAIALQEFKKLGIQGVIQGDIMFTKSDLKTVNKTFVKFQPNTITYRLPKVQTNGKSIGVVWHTQYKGETLDTMSASFDFDIAQLKQTKNVWMRDAKHSNGFVNVDVKHIKAPVGITKFLNTQKLFPSKLIGAKFKTFNNLDVKAGKQTTNSLQHALAYPTFVSKRYDIEIDKLKTAKAKEALQLKKQQVVSILLKEVRAIQSVTEFQIALTEAKHKVIQQLNETQDIACFIGKEQTNPEGYVAVGKKGAVKLVNRLEFSYNNFNGIKQWQKQ